MEAKIAKERVSQKFVLILCAVGWIKFRRRKCLKMNLELMEMVQKMS